MHVMSERAAESNILEACKAKHTTYVKEDVTLAGALLTCVDIK